jgi:hypothetical protein
MPSNDREPNQGSAERSDDYVKGGKGRKDDVRGSRLYPTSSPDAPRDAEIRTEGNLAKHKGPPDRRPKTFKRAI